MVVDLSEREQACVDMVLNWVQERTRMPFGLNPSWLVTLDHFLVMPSCSGVKGCSFLAKVVAPLKKMHAPSPPKKMIKCSHSERATGQEEEDPIVARTITLSCRLRHKLKVVPRLPPVLRSYLHPHHFLTSDPQCHVGLLLASTTYGWSA